MSPLEHAATGEPHAKPSVAFRLLDPILGHFVWAAHFLAIYIAAALACTLGIAEAGTSRHTEFIAGLVLLTGAAAAIVVIHGVRRYRQYKDVRDKSFVLALTLGNSGIATVGIVWQLFPILLAPLCA